MVLVRSADALHRPSCATLPGAAKGEKTMGGFADVKRSPAHFAFPIPDGIDPAEAAPMLCGGLTVYSPLAKYGAGTTAKDVGVVGVSWPVNLLLGSALSADPDLSSPPPAGRRSRSSRRALRLGHGRHRHRHLALGAQAGRRLAARRGALHRDALGPGRRLCAVCALARLYPVHDHRRPDAARRLPVAPSSGRDPHQCVPSRRLSRQGQTDRRSRARCPCRPQWSASPRARSTCPSFRS